MKKNKKKKLTVVALFAMLAIVSATFAWLTAQDNVENKFSTKQISGDDIKVEEIFEEPKDWQPGQEVTKDVRIANQGGVDFVSRIHYQETLNKLIEASGKVSILSVADPSTLPTSPTPIPKRTPVDSYESWTAITAADLATGSAGLDHDLIVKYKDSDDGKLRTYVAYRDLKDGTFQQVTKDTAKFETVEENGAKKVKIAAGITFEFYEGKVDGFLDWKAPSASQAIPKTSEILDFTGAKPMGTLALDEAKLISIKYDNVTATPTANNWFYNEKDGYFYYIGVIKPGGSTERLMETVTLKNNADERYGLMEMILDIHADGLQASTDAVKSEWNFDISTGGSHEAIYNAMKAAGAFTADK